MQISNINLSKIIPPAFDQRTDTDETADQELLDSIKQFGVLEPILVRQKVNQFEIIAGHRRFRMAQRAGLPTLPCIIQKAGDKETELIKIHENIHRLPLSHIDQGNTFLYLRETFSMNEAEIASLVGKSVPYVSQHLTLIKSDKEILDAVNKEEITFSAARELNQVVDPSERKRLLDIVRENGATVPVLQSWVRESNRVPGSSGPNTVYVPDGGQPPYSSNPTFSCQACDRTFKIGEMHIVRLCPSCEFSFKSAISLIQREEIPKNDNHDVQEGK